MSEGEEPDWELLPHEPQEFFGLADGYELRDLKRSYNQLVRRFKPERFPAEFQRIRAAYESLSDALRYDLPTSGGGASSWPVSPPSAPLEPLKPASSPSQPRQHERTEHPQGSSAPLQEPPPEAPPPAPLHERIVSTPLAAVYDELRSRSLKNGQDYVALALLSEVVGGASAAGTGSQSFVDWLLAGLAEYPEDWGLTQLLREYLSQEHTPAELGAILLRTVAVVPPQRFQYVTEKAWDNLLRTAPFSDFRHCLERCGTRLGKAVDHSQLVFYVHILKLAMWKGDDDFLTEMKEVVDDHFHSLGYYAQNEYELVAALLEYRARREEFVKRGPCCRRIDQAIQDWCLLSETEGDRSVLDCQYFLSLRGRRLLQELPDPNENLSYVMIPWNRIVSDVLDRLGEPPEQDERAVAHHAKDLMVRVSRRYGRTGRYNLGLIMIMSALAVVVIALVVLPSLFIRMIWDMFAAEGSWLSALLDGLLIIVWFPASIVVVFLLYRIGRNLSRLQYHMGRGEVFKLMRVTPLPLAQLAAIVAAREDEKFGEDESITDADVIGDWLKDDEALEIFGLAQVCLSAAASEQGR